MESLHSIPSMDPHGQEAFEALMDLMLFRVDEKLMGMGSLRSFEALDGQGFPEGYIHLHFKFMSSVMQLGRFDLLAVEAPWVYRTFRLRGVPEGFPLHIHMACSQVVRETLAPEHARPLVEAYEWLLDNHGTLAEEALDPGPGMADGDERVETFTRLLLGGDAQACLRFAEPYAESLKSFLEFQTAVVARALHRVGRLWERAEISVVEEHLASAMVEYLRAIHPGARQVPRPSRGLAVVCCPSGETHGMGCQMVSDQLEAEGWQVAHLGPDVPRSALLGLLVRKNPALLALSVASRFNLGPARRILQMVRGHPALEPLKVLAGGMAVNALPGLWRDLLADATAADAPGAAEVAAGFNGGGPI
jgi:methanogenic corrinoid protein MtbC1